MVASVFLFYVFSFVAIASAFLVIAARNPVHSVLFLILAFVNAAGLFMLLGAEFLAMILVVVYVGAVAVLFLFVVMMLDVDFAVLKQGFLQYLPLGSLIGAIVLIELVLVVGGWTLEPAQDTLRAAPILPDVSNTTALARPDPVHAIHLFLPDRRLHPADRHDRVDRIDVEASSGDQAAEHRCAEPAGSPHRGATAQGPVARGPLAERDWGTAAIRWSRPSGDRLLIGMAPVGS